MGVSKKLNSHIRKTLDIDNSSYEQLYVTVIKNDTKL